jgi:hypothetical protein
MQCFVRSYATSLECSPLWIGTVKGSYILCFGFFKRVHMPKIFMGTHYSLLCMGTDIDRFECLVCGYIFNPEAGDPGGRNPAGC